MRSLNVLGVLGIAALLLLCPTEGKQSGENEVRRKRDLTDSSGLDGIQDLSGRDLSTEDRALLEVLAKYLPGHLSQRSQLQQINELSEILKDAREISEDNDQPESEDFQNARSLSTPVSGEGHIVLRDDFSGCKLNTHYWEHELSMYGGYNWEFQVYTNDEQNVYLKDGHLFLRPTLTADTFGEDYLHNGAMDVDKLWGPCTNRDNWGCYREAQYGMLPPIMSGKLKSKPTISFGHVEVRARTPCGDWIWPALWMLPKDEHYGGWPRSGEIDLMESRGNAEAIADGVNHGNNEVTSTLHWGPDFNLNKYTMTHGQQRDTAWCQGFHTYTLDWTVDHITASVDNHVILNVPIAPGGFWQKGGFSGDNLWASGTQAAPFDQPFYFIMNVAVGGTNDFFPDGWQYNTPKPWSNSVGPGSADFWDKKEDWYPTWQCESAAMEIDYIQMKQY